MKRLPGVGSPIKADHECRQRPSTASAHISPATKTTTARVVNPVHALDRSLDQTLAQICLLQGTRRNPTGAPQPELARLRSRSPPQSSTTLQLDPTNPATSTLLPTFTPRIADRTPQPPRSRNLATVIHRADTDAHSRSSSLAAGTMIAHVCEDDLL
jgi:hypothetical protein